MQQYYDLEMNILTCLLLKPELMNNLKLEDKHFIKTQRMWQFMKAFYKKFETFDVALMYNVCSDKYRLSQFIEQLLDNPAFVYNFDKYQMQLINLYNQKREERYIIKDIYKLSNDLLVGNISWEFFYKKIEEKKRGVKMKEEKETTVCSNCGETVSTEDMGTSELAIQDHVCKECMEEGYGK